MYRLQLHLLNLESIRRHPDNCSDAQGKMQQASAWTMRIREDNGTIVGKFLAMCQFKVRCNCSNRGSCLFGRVMDLVQKTMTCQVNGRLVIKPAVRMQSLSFLPRHHQGVSSSLHPTLICTTSSIALRYHELYGFQLYVSIFTDIFRRNLLGCVLQYFHEIRL